MVPMPCTSTTSSPSSKLSSPFIALSASSPAGRAPCAGGGHFVAGVPPSAQSSSVSREPTFVRDQREHHAARSAKKRPLNEGPICLGSLWLGEVFASAI